MMHMLMYSGKQCVLYQQGQAKVQFHMIVARVAG